MKSETTFALGTAPITTLNELKQVLAWDSYRSYHLDFNKNGTVTLYLHPSDFQYVKKMCEPRLHGAMQNTLIFKEQTLWARIKMAYYNLRG
jgi:hypothetical protein